MLLLSTNLLDVSGASTAEVNIPKGSSKEGGNHFEPEILKIGKGATVKWTNEDDTLHTVTSGTPESGSSGTQFDSSYLSGGKTYEHTFKKTGTFNYYCTLHPYMTGKIYVSKSSPPPIETAEREPTLTSQDRVLIKLTPSGTTATGNVSPKNIKVKAGTTVVWQNMLPEKVYVQSKPDENHYEGELLNGTYIFPGESREEKLNEVGTFIYDGSNGFGSYYVRGTITVVNETTPQKKIPIEIPIPTTVPKSKNSYQLIIYLDNASTQNVIGDNFKILVYNSNNEPILSAKPNIDFNDDHQKISPPNGYPIIYQSGQYPKDIRVCAQQEYQLNGTTYLHNDCYPIIQNVQKTYWYTIFDYGEIDGFEADSNPIAKSNEMTPATVTPENKSESNNQSTGNITGMEQVTLNAQLKKDSLLTGWYDIKKFRLAVSDGSQICPSNSCEYTVESGKIFSLGDSSSYRADGKLKVTIAEDGSSKSTLYPLGVTLDKTAEEESNGQTIGKFAGTFEVGPHITYQVTNATLELDKKSPVLTIQGERSTQNSTSSE